MKSPAFSPNLVVADDAQLAAQLSCVLARPAKYLPVIDGPRLARPDPEVEVFRRSQAAVKVNPEQIFLAGLSVEANDALTYRFQARLRSKLQRIETSRDVDNLALEGLPLMSPPIMWGRNHIGVGLLKALRSRSNIEFSDKPSPNEHVPSKSGHLVICEDGDALAQVIAANYAFALRGGLYITPEVNASDSEDILEHFYNLYEDRYTSPTQALEYLKNALRDMCVPFPNPIGGSLTFFTGRLPYGFAFSDVPSTHLFKYPDLGIAVINGLAAEQPNTRGISVAVLVDPAVADAPEIEAAQKLLPPRGIFLRCYEGAGATVRAVTEMVELFPYDLLIIATHCGDASGYRWTYEYIDSEGIDRELVVDIAVGFARTDQPDMLNVTQFMRFVSLDGVDWNDPSKADKIHVGSAIIDFLAQTRDGSLDGLQPVRKETVPRVVGSAVLKMYDQNYISLPRSIADEGTPILINNACCSWHRLAETYTYCNARAYIGTLFPVSTSEAHDVVVKLLGKYFGKPLPAALWSAQHDVYGESARRPYIVTGVYPQRLRVSRHDVPRHIVSRLSGALTEWRASLRKADPGKKTMVKAVEGFIDYYERELAAFRKRWPDATTTTEIGDKEGR